MSDDFRALCAELASVLEELHLAVWAEASQLLNEDSGGSARLDLAIEDRLARARALLAQSEGDAMSNLDESFVSPNS